MPEKEEKEDTNPTVVFTIDGFIKVLNHWKEKGYPVVVVQYGRLDGKLSAPTKDHSEYRIPLTLAGDLFTSTSIVNVDPVGGNVPSCLLFIKKDNIKYLRADLAETIKEKLEKKE